MAPVLAADGIVGPGLQFISRETSGYVLVQAGVAWTATKGIPGSGWAAAGVGGTLGLGGDLRRFAHGATWFEFRYSILRFPSELGGPTIHYQTAFAVGFRWE